VVPASQLENLPMLGRDAAALERLAPGVVESSDRFGSYSVNGNQTQSNAFVLEGIDNNDGPLQDEGFEINPDALLEENIVSSTINPEFGRNSGSVINEVVKTGTNEIHGSGFEYYRDTFMNLGGYLSRRVLCPSRRAPPVPSESFRWHAWRTGYQEQALWFCRLPGISPQDGSYRADPSLPERHCSHVIQSGWKFQQRTKRG